MGWIGVDFDGTLATDADATPIPAMVERVKRWLSLGIEVRILTARVGADRAEYAAQRQIDERAFLKEWCLNHIGQELRITAEKDFNMYQLWDDRAIQVIKDTGERVGNINRDSAKHIGRTVIDEESGYRGV